jgi:hypothetical protein
LQLEKISVSTTIPTRKIHQLISVATPIATGRKMQVATILATRNFLVSTSLEKKKKLQAKLQLKIISILTPLANVKISVAI